MTANREFGLLWLEVLLRLIADPRESTGAVPLSGPGLIPSTSTNMVVYIVVRAKEITHGISDVRPRRCPDWTAIRRAGSDFFSKWT